MEGKNVKGCLVCWQRVGSSPGAARCHLSVQWVCGVGTPSPEWGSGLRPSHEPNPTSKKRHRQCGAHMGASQDFPVKTCFRAFFCPIRPGSPAPSRHHKEAAGTCRDELWIQTAYIQLLKAGPGSCQFPFFPPWGYSDLQQISSHCHSGVVLIIFLGLCRFNSSPATFLYKLGVSSKSTSKLIPCNRYLTFFASTFLQLASSSAKHSKVLYLKSKNLMDAP